MKRFIVASFLWLTCLGGGSACFASTFSLVRSAIPLKSGEVLAGVGFGFQDAMNGAHYVRVPRVLLGVGFADVVDFQVDYEYLFLRHDPFFPKQEESGDAVLATRLSFLRLYGYRFGLGVNVKLPNAADNKGMGTDETDVQILLLTSKTFGKLQLDFNVGIGLMGDPTKNADQKDLVVVGISASYPLVRDINLLAEFSMNSDLHDVRIVGLKQGPFFNDENILKAGGGLSFPMFWRIQGELLGRAGLTGDSPNYEIFFGLTRKFQLPKFPMEVGSS